MLSCDRVVWVKMRELTFVGVLSAIGVPIACICLSSYTCKKKGTREIPLITNTECHV
jgi:hypothetical protein